MKTLKYVLGVLISVVVLASCETKWVYYTPTNDDVSWESSGTTFALDAAETPIVIRLQRGVADKAISVPFTFNDPNGVYTISTTSLDFAVGEFVKEIELSYKYSSLVPGTEYTFDLEFDKDIVAPAGWNTYEGNGMMKLEYEPYKKVSNYQYVYNSDGWKYIKGCVFEDFKEAKGTLERAKGTTSYYRLTVFGGMVFEFKALNTGRIEVKKYAGYNEKITMTSSGRANSNWTFGGAAYYFHIILGAYSDIYTNTSTSSRINTVEIKSGNVFEVSGWWQKNGTYSPISTHTGKVYMDWLVEDL